MAAERSLDKNVRIRTFMPVLETILATHPVSTVLEFGMGMASTWFFLGQTNIHKLVSVETSLEWIKICSRDDPKHIVIHLENETYRALDDNRQYDLIFSDGVGCERLACTQAALRCSKFVIEHDTEVWDESDLINRRSDKHVMLRFNIQNPETTVWVPSGTNIQFLLNVGCVVV